VLVTLDTTRADHLSTYGYRRATDPRLAALAAGARVFEAAVPTATWTLPSHVSMFSGLDPAEHGAWLHLEDVGPDGYPVPSPQTPFFTGALRDAGYHLLAASGGPYTSRRYGLLRDVHEAVDPGERWELSAGELNAWIFDALDRRPKDRPLFLFVNYFDAHAPYDAPEDRGYPFPEEPRDLPAVPPLEGWKPGDPAIPEQTVRDAIDQYDRELLVQDEALGALLDRLERDGLLERALIVVTSDHGEMFGERPGAFGHGCPPWEPVARVPLVVQRRPSGPVDRIATPVSLANLADTILAAAGLAPLPAGGTPRFDLLAPAAALGERAAPPYVEHRGGEQWLGALRGARFKYGSGLDPASAAEPALVPPELLVDLVRDPGEVEDARGGEADAARARLRGALEELVLRWHAPPELDRAPLDAAELERLQGIGYGGR